MLHENSYSLKQIGRIFDHEITPEELTRALERRQIPQGQKGRTGTLSWTMADLPELGEHFGFLKPFHNPLAVAIFTTKGGVLKTTLTLNLARMAALHNIKTCVVGLDMQGDITTGLGHNEDLEESDDLQMIINKLNETRGLADVFNRTVSLDDVICPTEIPTLFYIPETPELASLNESLNNINRREYWLKEKILAPLKERFDLVIMDCSPNWNRLITNALVGCDVLISPLECKINNFRNFKLFRYFLNEFRIDMKLGFRPIFVPTKYVTTKKLTSDIRQWYLDNLSFCTKEGIREHIHGEEASAVKLSIPEYAPQKKVAEEMRSLLKEINQNINHFLKNRDKERPPSLYATPDKDKERDKGTPLWA